MIAATATLCTATAITTAEASTAEGDGISTTEFVYKGQVCYDHSYTGVASFKCDSGPSDSGGYQTQARCSNGAFVFGNFEYYWSSYYSLAHCPSGTYVTSAHPEPQYNLP